MHTQIEHWLMDEITRGPVAAGERLPGERNLAAALHVSRMTLRHVLVGLARRAVRLPGRSGGAFVAEPKRLIPFRGGQHDVADLVAEFLG